MVAMAIHSELSRRSICDALPADLADCLGAMFELNAARNETIRRQLIEVLSTLNAAGIRPLLLKGAASLLSPLYGDLGSRLIGDLDLLVPSESLRDASAALQRLGYQRALHVGCDEDHYRRFHHDAPLMHPDRIAAVELHRRYVISARGTRLMEALASPPMTLTVDGASACLPQPTERLAHNFLHQMVQDSGYVRGNFDLRQLYEAALLVSRYGTVIKWSALLNAVESCFCRHEWGAFAGSLNKLFRIHVPVGDSSWVQRRLWLTRALLQYRWPRMRRLNHHLYWRIHRMLPSRLRVHLGWEDYGWGN